MGGKEQRGWMKHGRKEIERREIKGNMSRAKKEIRNKQGNKGT